MVFAVEDDAAMVDAVRKENKRSAGDVARLVAILFYRATEQSDGTSPLAEIFKACDAPACFGPDFGIGLYRAPANKSGDVQRGACIEPGNAQRSWRAFQGPQPQTFGRRVSKELASAGKKIYDEAVPEANVAPCASWHGPEGKGDGTFPRLAVQLNDYVFNKLVNWSKERGQDRSKPDTSAIMEPIAHGLTEQQVKAIAAYVSFLE
ncbi:MAG: c-type cytochrome [Methylocystis sp.]